MPKKSFSKNLENAAVMQFISQPDPTPDPEKNLEQTFVIDSNPEIKSNRTAVLYNPPKTVIIHHPPKGFKFVEKKTRRVQIIMRPSLYDQVKSAAQASGISVNDFIHCVLEEAVASKEGDTND